MKCVQSTRHSVLTTLENVRFIMSVATMSGHLKTFSSPSDLGTSVQAKTEKRIGNFKFSTAKKWFLTVLFQ